MNLTTPDQLKTAYELMEAEVNFALSTHPKDDGFLNVDLSHVTMKFNSEQGFKLAEQLCKKVDDSGYYSYFSSYYTFFQRISICISVKEFKKVYYRPNHESEKIEEIHFDYHKPWNGYLKKQDAIDNLNWVINNRIERKDYSKVNKSLWQKLFGY